MNQELSTVAIDLTKKIDLAKKVFHLVGAEATVVSCDDPYPPRIGLRSHSRVDQMRLVNPEAIAGVR